MDRYDSTDSCAREEPPGFVGLRPFDDVRLTLDDECPYAVDDVRSPISCHERTTAALPVGDVEALGGVETKDYPPEDEQNHHDQRRLGLSPPCDLGGEEGAYESRAGPGDRVVDRLR